MSWIIQALIASYKWITSFPWSGLVSYWKLDESSGTAADSVWSNTGTLTGCTFWAANWKINNWVVNDGASWSKIDCWASTSLSVTTWDATWSFWMNNVATPASNDAFFCRMKNSELKWYYLNLPWGVLTFVSFAWSATFVAVTSNSPTDTWVWHHIAVTKSSTTVKIYIDNVERWSWTITNPQEATTPDSFRIWNYNSAAETLAPNTKYDEFWFWNRALSSTEISQLYNWWNWLPLV